MDSNIGHRVKELRINRGMTQEELADNLGITRSAWKAKENGESDFKAGLIVELSHIFNVSTDCILTGCSSTSEYSALASLRNEILMLMNRKYLLLRYKKEFAKYVAGYVSALQRAIELIDAMSNEETSQGAANDGF